MFNRCTAPANDYSLKFFRIGIRLYLRQSPPKGLPNYHLVCELQTMINENAHGFWLLVPWNTLSKCHLLATITHTESVEGFQQVDVVAVNVHERGKNRRISLSRTQDQLEQGSSSTTTTTSIHHSFESLTSNSLTENVFDLDRKSRGLGDTRQKQRRRATDDKTQRMSTRKQPPKGVPLTVSESSSGLLLDPRSPNVPFFLEYQKSHDRDPIKGDPTTFLHSRISKITAKVVVFHRRVAPPT